MRRQLSINLAIAISLILIGISLRLAPHPPNFAPVTALALFSGAVLPKKYGLYAALVIIILSDAIIGFHDLIAITWGCYFLFGLAGRHLIKGQSIGRGAVVTIGASIFFFVVTNFAVWLTSEMYPATLAGLGQAYTLAIPFFRNTLLSDVFYSGALFGLYALAIKYSAKTVKT
jgi:hypothetical protein